MILGRSLFESDLYLRWYRLEETLFKPICCCTALGSSAGLLRPRDNPVAVFSPVRCCLAGEHCSGILMPEWMDVVELLSWCFTKQHTP